jgi:hypothetical protein
VKRVPHGNGFETARGDAGQHEGDADGFGAAGGKEDLVQSSGGKLGQALRQSNRRDIRKAAGAESQTIHLPLDGLDHLRMAEADLVNAVAVKVEELAALQIFQVGARATSQNVQTGRRKRLMQKVASIFFQPVSGFGIDGGLLPLTAAWRKVHIAFGNRYFFRLARTHPRPPRTPTRSVSEALADASR